MLKLNIFYNDCDVFLVSFQVIHLCPNVKNDFIFINAKKPGFLF